MATNSALNKTWSCDPHKRHPNFTSCPQCFRPATAQVASSIKEIGNLDHFIPDKQPGIFTPKLEIVERLITEYLITPQLKCPYLLVLQLSVLNRRVDRDLIRNTWGSVAKTQTWPGRNINADVKVVFVIARQASEEPNKQNKTNRNQTHQEQIQSEADLHNDILYLDMIDSYRNLTLKLLSAFKWVRDNCPCLSFVLKVDFDTFVNVPLLLDALLYSESRLEFSILGMIYTGRSRVNRGGKWKVDKSLYPMANFPEYASGCGYVVSMKALSKILDIIPHYKMFPVEDAFITGVMRRVAGFKLFSPGRLFTHYLDKSWQKCQMFHDRKVLGLTVRRQMIQEIWDSFVKDSCS
ncbi:unnamed protein product [Candidula unifasciata]|uniref:Hexosyltransferase n=1 Tax=Candidula unifasciata TaxID=100452 RepID=A0A8S3Z9W4_9EUPU|nr:unnamed protein product [Candidula unifasciata]